MKPPPTKESTGREVDEDVVDNDVDDDCGKVVGNVGEGVVGLSLPRLPLLFSGTLSTP